MIQRMTCPICERELPLEITGENSLFPFCCLRCKQVDLHRWMSGGYSLVDQLTPDQLLAELPEEEDLPPDLRG